MALLLAPIGILAGTAILLQNQKSAVFTSVGPFQTSLEKTRFVTPSPAEVQDGYDTKIEVEVGASGKAPIWWQKGFGGYYGQENGRLVARPVPKSKNGQKLKVVGVPFGWSPHRDAESGKWKAIYLLKLAPIASNAGEIRLRDRVQIEYQRTKYGRPMWLDMVVRPAGVSTAIPAVSRDPKIKLERWVLDESPPVENFGPNSVSPGQKWRLRLWFRKRGPMVKNDSGVNDNLKVRDSRGASFSFWGSTSWHETEDWQFSYGADPFKVNPRQALITHDFTYDDLSRTAKPPLRIEGEAGWNKNWPLWVQIPFTDKSGKVLLSQLPKAPFKVVSVQARPASKWETSYSGADSTVEVRLRPLGNGKVWRWNGHFSQHVFDSKGKKHWEFAFKTGKSTSFPNFGNVNQQVIIKYPLILGSIPMSAGKLTFHAQISANGSARVPVSVVVRGAPAA
jgi:hypothetical protein